MKYLIIVFCCLFQFVTSTVVSPPITSPSNTTVAYTGCKFTVSWNTSVFFEFPGAGPLIGMIQLGFLLPNDTSEHLFATLDTNVDLLKGSDTVTIPSGIPPGNNYIIVVFGDSGNASPQFTIDTNPCCEANVTTLPTCTSTTPLPTITSTVTKTKTVTKRRCPHRTLVVILDPSGKVSGNATTTDMDDEL